MTQYFVRNSAGQVRGPFTGSQLKRLVREGEISGIDQIQPADRPDAIWRSVSSIDDLARNLPNAHRPDPTNLKSPHSSNAQADTESAPPQLPAVAAAQGIADRILRVGFAIGRAASVVVIVGSLLATVISAVFFLLNTVGPAPSAPPVASLVPPSFNDFTTSCRASNGARSSQTEGGRAGGTGPRRSDACEPFRDRLTRICELLGIAGMEDALCTTTTGFPADYRELFTAGLLSHAEAFYSANPKPPNCDGAMAAEWYIGTFERLARERESSLKDSLETLKSAQAQRAMIRNSSLTAAGLALISLIVFLALPLLIQIERNTRMTKPGEQAGGRRGS